MISKELLSEVLGKDIEIRGFKDKFIPANFEYIEDMVNVKIINIYELVHKCKEWAYEQSTQNSGYAIKTVFYKESVTCGLVGFPETITYENKSEPEAVFKACQWILEKKEG